MNVLTLVGYLGKIVPIATAIIADIGPAITGILADGGAAAEALMKVVTDFETTVAKIAADVKAAVK